MSKKVRVEPEAGVVASQFNALRNALALTQEQVAERADIDSSVPSKIESGDNLIGTYALRKSLAQAFDVSVEILANYLDGELSLEALLALKRNGLNFEAVGKTAQRILAESPRSAVVSSTPKR